jgi:excisionase family DNA binding protein
MERHAPTPDIFEAVVTAFADTLVRSYRDRWNRGGTEPGVKETAVAKTASPWLTGDEAASRAQCGGNLRYREVLAGRLRAVKVGGRRSLRFRAEWIDAWLEAQAAPSFRRSAIRHV